MITGQPGWRCDAWDPDVLIRWIYSPQAGVLVVMVPMGPEQWGPQSEEWVIHLNYPAGPERGGHHRLDRPARDLVDLHRQVRNAQRLAGVGFDLRVGLARGSSTG